MFTCHVSIREQDVFYCVCTQQSPGTGNYSMSCRVYAAAAAAAAAYRHGSAVADVGSGMFNYGRSCHEAAATKFCARDSTGLMGSGGRHCGPLYGYPSYGTYGVDGGSGRLCSAPEFVDIGDVDDITSRYLSCVGDRGLFSEHRNDLSLCGGEGFVPPLTQSSSSSSTALVELNDFVSRGDRLMQTGETPSACSRLPPTGAVSERLDTQWPPMNESSDSATTETSTTTRSSCLYSGAAVSSVAKSACSHDGGGAFTKTNVGVCDGAASFPDNSFGTSTCEKAKTLSSGNNRTNHTGL